MTTIAILGGDFEILFEDERVLGGGGSGLNPGLRMVRRATGATTTVYATNALYSAIAEVTDDFIAMGFRNPMLPVTPNAYTMENDFFMPRSSIEFLKEGAVTANWALKVPETGDDFGHGVIKKVYTVGLGTDFVTGDIGREITEAGSGDEGTLLDFDVDQNGDLVAWIRPIDSTPVTGDLFDTTGALEVTGDGGTGTVDSSVVGIAGTTQYSAVQAIGSVSTATEVYMVQDRFKLEDSVKSGFQWWNTDQTVSLGIISILVKVIDSGVTIAEGDVEVFARRYTSLYDNFRLNVIAGGFSALPLASAPDINNTTGYRRVTEVGATGTGPFVVGEIAIEQTTLAAVVITNVAGSTATPILQYYIVGDLTDLFTGGAETLDGQTSGATMTTAAPVANLLGPTDGAAGEGGSVTITLGSVEVDHDGDSIVEPYSAQVDAQGPGGSGVTAAKVYERMKFVCRRGADNTVLFGAGVNVPGETYRGADGVYEVDAFVAAMTEGDDLDIVAKTSYSGRLMSSHDRAIDHITVMDQQTSLQTLADNDALRDETPDTVVIENGAGATLFFAGAGGGIEVFTSPKASPFCTFTGTVIFGARCISFVGFHDNDTQNYILTDDLGVLNSPPNTVTFSVFNTVAGDNVLVARDTGVLGVVDKDQFGGLAAQAIDLKTLTIAGTIDSEVPTAGFVRAVELALQQEHTYVYDSITGTTIFNLRDITAASATGATSDTLLNKTGGPSFITEDVVPGMLIGVISRTSIYEVVTRTDADNLVIKLLYGAGGFVSGDAYTINETVQAYATSDNVYDLILDVEATGTTESNTFVQSTSFDVVVNVRRGGAGDSPILPFTTNPAVGASGGSATVVRAPDTIAT